MYLLERDSWHTAPARKPIREETRYTKGATEMSIEEWSSIAAIMVAIGSLAFSFWQRHDNREVMDKLEKVIVSYEKTIVSFERQLKKDEPAKKPDPAKKADQTINELELRRVALEERKQAWKELAGVGSAAWAVYQKMKEDEDE